MAIILGDDGNLNAVLEVNGNETDSAVAEFENTYFGEKSDAPPTMDGVELAFWLVMMIVSGVASAVLLSYEKRRRI